MPIDIIPFHDELLAAAGQLLAARHRRDRATLPWLPERFEDAAIARKAVETSWRKPHTTGVAALRNGQLVGYLLGSQVLEEIWGRAAWIRPPGIALAEGEPYNLLGELYAALGDGWLRHGCFAHFALLPIADPALIQAWFMLSFGVEQVVALQPLENLEPPQELPGITIRRAVPEDRGIMADFSDLIWQHLVRAPVWGIHLPESSAENCAGWAELVDDPTVDAWLAFAGEQAVGTQAYYPSETTDDNMLLPELSVHFTVAATRPAMRGRGITSALSRHGLLHAREKGYRYCDTDWRSTNLEAACAWTRLGFVPMAYRLVRRVDQRIAWANE